MDEIMISGGDVELVAIECFYGVHRGIIRRLFSRSLDELVFFVIIRNNECLYIRSDENPDVVNHLVCEVKSVIGNEFSVSSLCGIVRNFVGLLSSVLDAAVGGVTNRFAETVRDFKTLYHDKYAVYSLRSNGVPIHNRYFLPYIPSVCDIRSESDIKMVMSFMPYVESCLSRDSRAMKYVDSLHITLSFVFDTVDGFLKELFRTFQGAYNTLMVWDYRKLER